MGNGQLREGEEFGDWSLGLSEWLVAVAVFVLLIAAAPAGVVASWWFALLEGHPGGAMVDDFIEVAVKLWMVLS